MERLPCQILYTFYIEFGLKPLMHLFFVQIHRHLLKNMPTQQMSPDTECRCLFKVMYVLNQSFFQHSVCFSVSVVFTSRCLSVVCWWAGSVQWVCLLWYLEMMLMSIVRLNQHSGTQNQYRELKDAKMLLRENTKLREINSLQYFFCLCDTWL